MLAPARIGPAGLMLSETFAAMRASSQQSLMLAPPPSSSALASTSTAAPPPPRVVTTGDVALMVAVSRQFADMTRLLVQAGCVISAEHIVEVSSGVCVGWSTLSQALGLRILPSVRQWGFRIVPRGRHWGFIVLPSTTFSRA